MLESYSYAMYFAAKHSKDLLIINEKKKKNLPK